MEVCAKRPEQAHLPSTAAAALSAPAASRCRAHDAQPASAAQCSGVRPSVLSASAGAQPARQGPR